MKGQVVVDIEHRVDGPRQRPGAQNWRHAQVGRVGKRRQLGLQLRKVGHPLLGQLGHQPLDRAGREEKRPAHNDPIQHRLGHAQRDDTLIDPLFGDRNRNRQPAALVVSGLERRAGSVNPIDAASGAEVRLQGLFNQRVVEQAIPLDAVLGNLKSCGGCGTLLCKGRQTKANGQERKNGAT